MCVTRAKTNGESTVFHLPHLDSWPSNMLSVPTSTFLLPCQLISLLWNSSLKASILWIHELKCLCSEESLSCLSDGNWRLRGNQWGVDSACMCVSFLGLLYLYFSFQRIKCMSLTFTWTRNRFAWGQLKVFQKSRFLMATESKVFLRYNFYFGRVRVREMN